MQFITNGPDIPDALLQAHEEGRVVFFCGAGISYPAGLPSFKGLVEQIYNGIYEEFSDIELEAFNNNQFDTTLDLLERRLPGQRIAVRSKLAEVLNPDLRKQGATDTHAALLRLARGREGAVRLVTTNFDRLFHEAAKRTNQDFQEYAAPFLPIPKNSHWDGLVYLHGLLPEGTDNTALNRLVFSSGDFGLAYLTERWAARFVSELFRKYVVCFVGYSINDPVLRYMLDALAADRMLGEATLESWALGAFKPGQEHKETMNWKAKGVTPILYSKPTGTEDHSALHKTLHAWAKTYCDGVQGKENIVAKHALARPQNSTRQDDFVGRVLWALSDKTGLPAKRFADLDPAPALDWLFDAFTINRFEHSDLARFGVPPREDVDTKLRFSLIRRPAPYDSSPRMALASGNVSDSSLDNTMIHLGRWLMRHLDDPELLIWISGCGGTVHNHWQRMIEHELNRLASLESEGKKSELDEIRRQSPNAIPSPPMRSLWNLLLSGRVKSPRHKLDFYRWQQRLKSEGLTTSIRLELRELLSPKVVLKKRYPGANSDSKRTDEPTRINQLVDWELVLTEDHVHTTLINQTGEPWETALAHMLDDFQQLLRDALDLFRELGSANHLSDRSDWDLPSIARHRQNRGFRDWVSLIELLRDAWLAVRTIDGSRATRTASRWFEIPYPTFKRLALFAASQEDCIEPEQWVDWLLAEGAWWLWSINTRREVCRLLVLQGSHLAGDAQQRLETGILEGPPSEMYSDELEDGRRQNMMARSIWLRLAKLNSSGLVLGKFASAKLAELSIIYPDWQLATDESDEFSVWMSSTGDPGYEDSRDVEIAPTEREELVQWLKKPTPSRPSFHEDTWSDVCKNRFFHSLFALCDLAQDDEWPARRWEVALQTWAKEEMVLRSWRYAAPLVTEMPDKTLQEISPAVTWWMETVSKSIRRNESILMALCSRFLKLPLEVRGGNNIIRNGEEVYDPIFAAINHPIGRTTEALINLWLKQNPNDNDSLPDDFKALFTALCDLNEARFCHGRVILGSRLITFFRVDRRWTEQNLLPLFNWSDTEEAKDVWQGFLHSPRLHQPLLIAFKSQFLESVKNYNNLGEYRKQYAIFLTYAALAQAEGYSAKEFKRTISALPPDGLEESARALSQALASAADQSEEYWKNRVQPFWSKVWPNSIDLATPRIAESLSRLVISARGVFPSALEEVKDWLQPLDNPFLVINLLSKSGLCSRFPAEALKLLDAINNKQQSVPPDLGLCLDQIGQSSPKLEHDRRYLDLRDYIRINL